MANSASKLAERRDSTNASASSLRVSCTWWGADSSGGGGGGGEGVTSSEAVAVDVDVAVAVPAAAARAARRSARRSDLALVGDCCMCCVLYLLCLSEYFARGETRQLQHAAHASSASVVVAESAIHAASMALCCASAIVF